MRKLFLVIMTMVFVSSFGFAQPAAPASTSVAKIANSTISGKISSKEKPLRGITVNLARNGQGGGGRNGQSVKTDQEGKFKFTNVAAGNYVVMPNAMSHVPDSSDVTGPFRGKSVVVNDNENVENVDISMRIGGVITGKILRPDGAPAIEQRVSLKTKNPDGTTTMFFSASTAGMSNATDDRGVFRVFGIPSGQYLVSAGESGGGGGRGFGNFRQRYPVTYYPSVAIEAEAQVVEVTEGNETKDIEIRLGEPLPTYEAKGKVIDAITGIPVVGAQVGYRQVAQNQRGAIPRPMNSNNERSDLNGEFLISGIEKGKYVVTVQPGQNSEYYSDEVNFEIADADADSIEIRASRGASVNGFVVIDGAQNPGALASSGLGVMAMSRPQTQGGGRGGAAMMMGGGNMSDVAANGAFQIKGLKAGRVTVNVQSRSSDARYSIVRIEREGVDVTNGFDVGSGEVVSNIRVIVAIGNGIIRGQINVVGGALPAGTVLRVVASKSNAGGGGGGRGMGAGNAQADQNGRFVIEGLVSGEYTVTAMAMPTGFGGGRPMPGGGGFTGGGGFQGGGVPGGGARGGGRGGGNPPTGGNAGGGAPAVVGGAGQAPQFTMPVKPVSQTVMLNGAEASVVMTLDVSTPPAGGNK